MQEDFQQLRREIGALVGPSVEWFEENPWRLLLLLIPGLVCLLIEAALA